MKKTDVGIKERTVAAREYSVLIPLERVDIIATALDHGKPNHLGDEEFGWAAREIGHPAEELVAFADHSWGGRRMELMDDAKTTYLKDEAFDGGWTFFSPREADCMEMESFSSGSKLEVRRLQDDTQKGWPWCWELKLVVPIVENLVGHDGYFLSQLVKQPSGWWEYRGEYYRSFERAAALLKEQQG